MNQKIPILLGAALCSLFTTVHPAFAQGTAFTYQGRLSDGNSSANGIYDLEFTIYDSTNSPGTVVAGPLTNSATSVSNGIFTVTLDFGAGIFTGAARWLGIGVRTNGAGAFTPLTPRQPLTAIPYALYARTPAGPPGQPGAVWREGSGAPANGLGIDGDYYLNGSTGDVYQRASGSYTVVCNIKGSQGPAGVALPFRGVGVTNINLFEVDNFGSGDALAGLTGTGYGVFGQANSAGGWGGLFRYGVDGNNSAYLGGNGSAGAFYGAVTVNGATSNSLFRASNSGSGQAALFDGVVQVNGTLSASAINSGEVYAYNTAGDGYGLKANGSNIGLFAQNTTTTANVVYLATTGLAGDFYGNVYVHGTVTQTSDRNAKENFAPVDTGAVLDKVAGLPLESWNYKGDAASRHVGPMAQDFRAAFALGLDDKSICSVDADGVALAAIQGLNRKLEAKSAEIEQLKQSVVELKEMVSKLAREEVRSAECGVRNGPSSGVMECWSIGVMAYRNNGVME